jgi:NADPH-dependent 2,4-dienoyl-CoA reductase/sulfur reductase-like enzyme
MAALRSGSTPVIGNVVDLEAAGRDRIERLSFRTEGGAMRTVEADTLLVHEGIVPNLHPALSLDCAIAWNSSQDCFAPVLDSWGESSQSGLFIAGDGAGIAGAKAALLRGELAALRVAARLGRLPDETGAAIAQGLRRKLRRELAPRPFLDALFRPRPQVFVPADHTIVCRCEEITAGEIRAVGEVGCPGPNQAKAATRAGMGPCQGRQCAYTLTRLLAAVQHRSPSDVGFFHVRPPLKPVTLGELAALDRSAAT